MTKEVVEILADIAFFAGAINDFYFITDAGKIFEKFPSVAEWTRGHIVLKGVVPHNLVTRLATWGIEAEELNDGVRFPASAGDSIIHILGAAIQQQEQQKELSLAKWKLSGLEQNVDQLIEQRPYVRRGVFSHGVNAFTHQVDVLKGIRAEHQKLR